MAFLNFGKQYQKKLDICKSCEKYDRKTKTCRVCKCVMPMKAMLSGNTCPLNKHNV